MKGTSFSTRTGKIARLPQDIRQQLHRRLEYGESAQELVAGKQGGLLDWQRHQESRAVRREFLGETGDLGKEAGEELLLERMGKRRNPRVIAANRA